MSFNISVWMLGVLVMAVICCEVAAAPLKVYILAGQSNMQGSAHQSTFVAAADDLKILDPDGQPVVCENTWISYRTSNRQGDVVLNGKVKVGYGFDSERIGPEYGFGLTVDDPDQPVLIIKAAWGGKSLAVDFRPPSAGPYVPSEKEAERGAVPEPERVGHFYREMIDFVHITLKDAKRIGEIVPGYDANQGFELAGFVWFQGWNDMCNRHHIAQYSENMIDFICDVRKEFEAPELPFIVGILGVYGTDPSSRKFDKGLPVTAFRRAQFAAVEQYDQKAPIGYRGRVIAVDSGPFYDLALSDIYWKRRLTGGWKRRLKQGEMTQEKYTQECARYGFGDGELTAEEAEAWERGASNAEYHYLGSAQTFVRFGKALGQAMLRLEAQRHVLIAAHRGGYESDKADQAPENSLANIQVCQSKGYPLYETDIQRTKDGHFVIMHDRTIDRETTGTGVVSEMMLADLKGLHQRYRDGSVSEEGVATLEEFLEQGKGRTVFKADLKPGVSAHFPAIMKQVVELGALDGIIFRLPYSEAARFEAYKAGGVPYTKSLLMFKVSSKKQLDDIQARFDPLFIQINLSKKDPSATDTLALIRYASSRGLLVETHADGTAEDWAKLVDAGVRMFHSSKPSLVQAFLHGRSKAQ